MSRPPRAAADLDAAAAVHAAREEIVQALGPLAASPLDEQATARMRQALERAQSPAVRRAVRRISGPGESRPPLVAVPTRGDGAASRVAPAVATAPLMAPVVGSSMCAPSGAA